MEITQNKSQRDKQLLKLERGKLWETSGSHTCVNQVQKKEKIENLKKFYKVQSATRKKYVGDEANFGQCKTSDEHSSFCHIVLEYLYSIHTAFEEISHVGK